MVKALPDLAVKTKGDRSMERKRGAGGTLSQEAVQARPIGLALHWANVRRLVAGIQPDGHGASTLRNKFFHDRREPQKDF